MSSKENLLERARYSLSNAVKYDNTGQKLEAVKAYSDGIEIMLELMSSMTDEKDRSAFRSKIEQYMSRAESLRSAQGRTVKVQFLEQRLIGEDAKGHSYESIFSKCLDDKLTEVVVEDPYIIAHHQIINFVMFCELLVSKCPKLKMVTLITGEKTMQDSLNELVVSLRVYNIVLHIELREFHDREIRFNNGWLVKIGRGLDIYKAVGKYAVGSHAYHLRPCKKTIVDIFRFA